MTEDSEESRQRYHNIKGIAHGNDNSIRIKVKRVSSHGMMTFDDPGAVVRNRLTNLAQQSERHGRAQVHFWPSRNIGD